MLRLTESTQRRVLAAADEAVRKVIEDGNDGDEFGKGGYFRLFLLGTDCTFGDMVQLTHGWVGGNRNYEKCEKYYVLSFEKALRVVRAIPEGDLTSRAFDHNSKLGQYGGASMVISEAVIESNNGPFMLVSSFSGLTEEGDETVGLDTLSTLGWVDRANIERVLENSNNAFGRNFFEVE